MAGDNNRTEYMHMHNTNDIDNIPCPLCKLCGYPGVPIYQKLQDRLFASPGFWNFNRCKNQQCRAMWLDPMPIEHDIYKAYLSYFTHVDDSRPRSKVSEIFTLVKRNLLLSILRLTPIYRERVEFNRMYLDNIKPGKLLAVGCGNGDRLAHLKALGWNVEGQEVDPVSAAIASRYGIKVHLGRIETLNLPGGSYDAIVMFHVIEHLHDPMTLLIECKRLLSPRGLLTVITPNTDSYGHRIFKSCWRGLEPPRHLLLFNQQSLRLVAQNAGFKNVTTWTTACNAHHFALGSLNILHATNDPDIFAKAFFNLCSKCFLILARIIYIFDKNSGEECVLICENRNS